MHNLLFFREISIQPDDNEIDRITLKRKQIFLFGSFDPGHEVNGLLAYDR